MCGRYAAAKNPDDLVEEFEVVAVPQKALAPDWNVAPTKDVYAVMVRPPREDKQAEPRRELAVVRWGLVPSWAKDPSIGNRMINARMETVAEKPAFKRAFAKRRCILPADGYYEWYTPEDGPKGKGGKPLKQPFFIRPADGSSLAMAGLYELWRDPTREDDDPKAWLMTCTVLTTTAEDAVGRIHDRMPLLVERDRWQEWLDPAGGGDDPRHLLVPAAPGRLEAYPVSTAVNDVRHNGPELVEPLPLEESLVDAGGGSADDQPSLF
ncbi:MAG: SOS response-associated peptidase [Actinobacteria bacterium]|nr:SOS response-associated peptidase [Actinomycetota bacterium]